MSARLLAARLMRASTESDTEININITAPVDGEPTPPVEVAEPVEKDEVEVVEASQDVEETEEGITELDSSAATLEGIVASIESALVDGGVSPQAARFMNIAVGQVKDRLGFPKDNMPALESYESGSNRLVSTQASLEDAKAMLTKIWEGMKNLMLRAWEGIVAFFGKLTGGFKNIAAKAKALQATAKSLKGKSSTAELESGAAGSLTVGGRFDPTGAMLNVNKGTEWLFNTYGTALLQFYKTAATSEVEVPEQLMKAGVAGEIVGGWTMKDGVVDGEKKTPVSFERVGEQGSASTKFKALDSHEIEGLCGGIVKTAELFADKGTAIDAVMKEAKSTIKHLDAEAKAADKGQIDRIKAQYKMRQVAKPWSKLLNQYSTIAFKTCRAGLAVAERSAAALKAA